MDKIQVTSNIIGNEFISLLPNENKDGILVLDTDDYYFIFYSTEPNQQQKISPDNQQNIINLISIYSNEYNAQLVLYVKNKNDVSKTPENYFEDAVEYLKKILFKRSLLLSGHGNLGINDWFWLAFRDFVKKSWWGTFSQDDKSIYKLRLYIPFVDYKDFIKEQLLGINSEANINFSLVKQEYLISRWSIGEEKFKILEEDVKNRKDNYKIAFELFIPHSVIDSLCEEMI